MSKFIPNSAVYREAVQQQKRQKHGLATGRLVKFPDAIKGPYVLKAELAEELRKKETTHEEKK